MKKNKKKKSKEIGYAKVIKVNNTFGFVQDIKTEEEIFIPGRYMKGMLPEDKVKIKIFLNKKKTLLEGRVLDIEKTNKREYIGKIMKKNDEYCFMSYNINFPLKLDLCGDKEVRNGDLVRVVIKRRGNDNNAHIAEIKSIIGSVDDPESCCKMVLEQNNVTSKFDEGILREAENLAKRGIKEIEYKMRRDLREETIFTMDGKDSKDLDDAVSIEKKRNGKWRLGVHIADVSYYVKSGSRIDKEAYERGTSIYYLDTVIPMLPIQLSNGVCSLNPGEDRLAFSVFMDIDEKGEIEKYKFEKTVIRSKVKGIYEEINDILAGKENGKEKEKYKKVRDKIYQMSELAQELNKQRKERNSIDFEIEECEIIKKKEDEIDIRLKKRGKAERIIEEFMIKANEAAAMFAQANKLPFIYRQHEEPVEEKLVMLAEVLTNMNIEKPKNGTQKEIVRVLAKVKDERTKYLVNNILLRAMAKARYSAEHKPHYGLALLNYSHFTSPIRRYPDLMIHRIMSEFLARTQMKIIKKPKISKKNSKVLKNKVAKVAIKASLSEKKADNIERDCEDIYKAYYMKSFIGHVFNGFISSIVPYGFYVRLPNTIEGLVNKDSLPDGHYECINLIELKNLKNNDFSLKLGDKVKVKLINSDVFSGKIDFEFMEIL